MSSSLAITAVEIHALDIPLRHPFTIARGTIRAAGNVLVRIRTAAGVTGVGEGCPFFPITGETQEGTLDAARRLREIALGLDALHLELLEREFAPFLRTDPSAVAAYDTALHDILGKVAGLPLYRLLGGDRPWLATDITTYLGEPETMAAEAAAFVARGFDTIKVKVGQDPDLDLRRLRAIREAIGPDRGLRIDANQGWTPAVAIAALRRMEPLGVEFVEQPVAADDLGGLRAVHEAGPIPVMADESLYSPADALRLIRAGACAAFNVKLMKAGGIRNMIRIAHLADAAGLPCMVGAMVESRLAQTAAAHVAAAHGIFRYADLDAHESHAVDPIQGGMAFEKGRVTLPQAPGIGADVDPGFLAGLRSF